MHHNAKVLSIVLLILVLFTTPILAETEIMPLNEVESGMRGHGRTVLRGTEIEEFDVEIISILEEPALNHDLILVETSGDVIKRSGGISSGMSGSPIYVEGKLIGAIGYGWQMADHKVGLVTPIESMLDIFKLDDVLNGTDELDLARPIEIGDKSYNRVKFTAEDREFTTDTLVAKPVSTPLMVSGLSGRAKDMVGDLFGEYNMELAPVGGGIREAEDDIELEPGSAVAAQLVRGDINISAIGTMTYRDDDQVVAFAHPFLSQGKVDYMLSSAYIHKMITSIQMPFKLGSPAELEGSITQDRAAGIAGKIGQYPKIVPMEVNVIDRDLGEQSKYKLQIVQDEKLLEQLSLSTALQAIDSTIDRQGSGTAKVSMEILANNLEDNIISKENYFYSGNDIAAVSLMDYVTLMSLIVNNPYKEINLANIKLNVEIEESHRVALIEEIVLEQEEVRAGDKVKGQIFLQPYRDEVIAKDIEIEIPEDISPGTFDLAAFSGQEANYERMYRLQYEEEEEDKIASMSDLLQLFQEQKKNNQLVVELLPHYGGHYYENGAGDDEQEREQTDDTEEIAEEKTAEPTVQIEHSYFEKVIDSAYVLEGTAIQEIRVIADEQAEEDSNNQVENNDE